MSCSWVAGPALVHDERAEGLELLRARVGLSEHVGDVRRRRHERHDELKLLNQTCRIEF